MWIFLIEVRNIITLGFRDAIDIIIIIIIIIIELLPLKKYDIRIHHMFMRVSIKWVICEI